MVVIKLHRNEDLLRFSIDENTAFVSFQEHLKKFYLQDVTGAYELKYRDDEQDMVWLTSKKKFFFAVFAFFCSFFGRKKKKKKDRER
jgi:hypothetical protein